MKSWFGSGKPRARRVSLDLHYGARTSVWSEIVARSHLIVAAIGTASLLGLAGTAIWLALPSDADGRLVSPAEAGQRIDTIAAGPEDTGTAAASAATTAPEAKAAQPATNVAASAPAPAIQPSNPSAGQSGKAAAIADPVSAQAAATAPDQPDEAEVEPLASSDPRWVDPAKAGGAAKMAGDPAKPAASPAQNGASIVNAYAGTDAADQGATAAIPGPKPEAEAKAAETKATARAVRTLRAVTMRARPNDRGNALTTVPGRTEVQVVSCDRWCEVIYKGKRGFVFRRFLVNNGR